MKYQIGDKPYVINDLTEGVWYGDTDAVEEMLEFKGKQVTICDIVCDVDESFYSIEEDGEMWSWTDEMLEDI